jgi:hypothetical protein
MRSFGKSLTYIKGLVCNSHNLVEMIQKSSPRIVRAGAIDKMPGDIKGLKPVFDGESADPPEFTF